MSNKRIKSKDKIKYGYNNICLTKNGEPYFPIAGEMHYCRTNRDKWKDSLIKMKNGGIEIVSTYVFWIYHEEIKGQYNFDGNLDIRAFAEVINEVGLKMWLRVGPFIHAEVRNGGLPDWLINKNYKIRSNDKKYLDECKRFYKKIYEQLYGLFDKDGGPIIGIQVENEYGHVGDYDSYDSDNHINTLKKMLIDIGFDVPFYTATAWGNASFGNCLPVMGGYCDKPWERENSKLPPNENFLITPERDERNILNDKENISFAEYEKVPYLCAEIGSGIASTYLRRPLIRAKDIFALTVCKIASGCNMLGYYMYHGGINKFGELTTLNETRKSGSYSDLPEYDYDFNAPIGSYGNINESYGYLKLINTFIRDFGHDLCLMKPYFKQIEIDDFYSTKLEDNLDKSEIKKLNDYMNLSRVRSSVRTDGKSGFLFLNNYVRGYDMDDHLIKEYNIELDDEIITFKNINLKNGDCNIFPFNLSAGDLHIRWAKLNPLCLLRDESGFVDYVVFHTNSINVTLKKYISILGVKSRMINVRASANKRFYLLEVEGKKTKCIILKTNDALNAYKISKKRECICVDDVRNADNDFEISVDVKKEKEYISNLNFEGEKDALTIDYNIYINYNCNVDDLKNSLKGKGYDDVYLNISYSGDIARILLDGKVVNDNFYTGKPWLISLSEYGFPDMLTMEIVGMPEENNVYYEKELKFKNGVACKLDSISLREE